MMFGARFGDGGHRWHLIWLASCRNVVADLARLELTVDIRLLVGATRLRSRSTWESSSVPPVLDSRKKVDTGTSCRYDFFIGRRLPRRRDPAVRRRLE
ncbi:hypothetical protein E2562_036117 [Oryza meyeriana var. granulata]|uniref:Uncharacterized protein n=1 Tax=Oryza meyeriana var. granulata TaxID=110450 RepID=A0A6G1CL36_9ORYZ|nr:hypothetical protein E2562_036117 [Oryza meyeriana var. granulata]